MQPLRFHPILKRIRWGGRRLGTLLGKPIGEHADYAESWEIADCGRDQSIVSDGPYAGWPLSRLMSERRQELLGRDAHFFHFPLLVKLLDASDRLSVQVHPNDIQAQETGVGHNGKTEAWVILDARPESRIYAGLKTGIDQSAFARHFEAGRIEDCLHSFAARAGDSVFIPAGTVHAIGEGILLAEIQQSSDVTYRIFDWGRRGPDGKERTLHPAEAMACIDFTHGPIEPATPQMVESPDDRREELVRCEYFVLVRHNLKGPLTLPNEQKFRILMSLSGRVEIATQSDRFELHAAETVLIPADALDVRICPSGAATVLEAFLP
jgi:mannose-6-phosphate isomerase